MSVVKYQDIWKLFANYQFDIDTNLHVDLLCIICGKIMRNATQGYCGCRYCLSCIGSYLNGQARHCPGKTSECQDQSMDIDNGLLIDNAINRKISLVKVKCPERFCDFVCALQEMTVHMESHEMKCPYTDMGCNTPRGSIGPMSDHLSRDNYAHAMLLTNYAQNLRNEIDCTNELTNRNEVHFTDCLIDINRRCSIICQDAVADLIQENRLLMEAVSSMRLANDEMRQQVQLANEELERCRADRVTSVD